MTEKVLLEMCKGGCGNVLPPKDWAKLPRSTLRNGAGDVVVFVDDDVMLVLSVRDHEGDIQRAYPTTIHRDHLGEATRIASENWAEWSAVGPDHDIYVTDVITVEAPDDQEE